MSHSYIRNIVSKRTVEFLWPFHICDPRFLRRDVERIADDGFTGWSWWVSVLSSLLTQQNPAGEGESRDNDQRGNRQIGRHVELFGDKNLEDDEANSEDEQDFISNASIFFLGNPLQSFCALMVRNP